jgi:hypothetical protein
MELRVNKKKIFDYVSTTSLLNNLKWRSISKLKRTKHQHRYVILFLDGSIRIIVIFKFVAAVIENNFLKISIVIINK